MRASLGWDYATAGFMNTANAAGYLLGAILAPMAVRWVRQERLIFFATLSCVVAVAILALTSHFETMSAARFVAGTGSALAFVLGGSATASISEGQPAQKAFLLSLFYAGPGIGIVLSGVITPFVFGILGPNSWRVAWASLGAVSMLLALPLAFVRAQVSDLQKLSPRKRLPLSPMMPLALGYGAFGAGYIAYMTFMIAWIEQAGGGAPFQALFWATLGCATIASPWLWSPLIGKMTGGRAVAALTTVTLAGAVIPLVASSTGALLVSALLFGCAFFSVVAATTSFARRNFPRELWASAIAVLTVAFGIGQMVGPLLTGTVTDLAGGTLSDGLWTSAGLLLSAVLIPLLQRDIKQVMLHRSP
jgi:predicted MFS family arabinose efflux permease